MTLPTRRGVADHALTPEDRLADIVRRVPWLPEGLPGGWVCIQPWAGFKRQRPGRGLRPGGPVYYELIVAHMGKGFTKIRDGDGRWRTRIYLGNDPLVVDTVKAWILARRRRIHGQTCAMLRARKAALRAARMASA